MEKGKRERREEREARESFKEFDQKPDYRLERNSRFT
jgi:hypothetical protein